MSFLIPQTEAEFQRVVTDYAESLGWHWLHIGRTGKYAANGAKGTLGEGWPDLFLVKGDRAMYVELKSQGGVVSERQKRVMMILSEVAEVYVWRPSDIALMAEVLHHAP